MANGCRVFFSCNFKHKIDLMPAKADDKKRFVFILGRERQVTTKTIQVIKYNGKEITIKEAKKLEKQKERMQALIKRKTAAKKKTKKPVKKDEVILQSVKPKDLIKSKDFAPHMKSMLSHRGQIRDLRIEAVYQLDKTRAKYAVIFKYTIRKGFDDDNNRMLYIASYNADQSVKSIKCPFKKNFTSTPHSYVRKRFPGYKLVMGHEPKIFGRFAVY